MKPVLIQNLIRHNKKHRRSADPVLEDVAEHHNRAADFVFWFVIGIVVLGLLLA
jgi:hypothetical protein